MCEKTASLTAFSSLAASDIYLPHIKLQCFRRKLADKRLPILWKEVKD